MFFRIFLPNARSGLVLLLNYHLWACFSNLLVCSSYKIGIGYRDTPVDLEIGKLIHTPLVT